MKSDEFNALRVEGNVATDVRSTEEFCCSAQRGAGSSLEMLFPQIQRAPESGSDTAAANHMSIVHVVLLVVQRVGSGAARSRAITLHIGKDLSDVRFSGMSGAITTSDRSVQGIYPLLNCLRVRLCQPCESMVQLFPLHFATLIECLGQLGKARYLQPPCLQFTI